jgi:hypothetical protein
METETQILNVRAKEMCEKHKPFKGGYMAHMAFMEEKEKHGAKQKQCKDCGYWYYKSEY